MLSALYPKKPITDKAYQQFAMGRHYAKCAEGKKPGDTPDPGLFKKAEDQFNNALKTLEKQGCADHPLAVQIHLQCAFLYISSKNHSRDCSKKALGHSREGLKAIYVLETSEIIDQTRLAFLFIKMIAHSFLGEIEPALKTFDEVKQLAENLDCREMLDAVQAFKDSIFGERGKTYADRNTWRA